MSSLDRIFARKERGGSRKLSDRHERGVASAIGGKVQLASGALPFAKGDVKAGEFLIECKATSKDSLSVKLEWLEKISREAQLTGKIPALSIRFDNASLTSSKDWVAVPLSVFQKIVSEPEKP